MNTTTAKEQRTAVAEAWRAIQGGHRDLAPRQVLERLVALALDPALDRTAQEDLALRALPRDPAGLARLLELGLALVDAAHAPQTTARTGHGAFYTPPALVESLLRIGLLPQIEAALASPLPQLALSRVQVIDPACGGGHFLVAAVRHLAAAWQQVLGSGRTAEAWQRALGGVAGIDIEPLAVLVAGAALQRTVPPDITLGTAYSAPMLQISDFLALPPQPQFSLVVGNPPFLSQLQTATLRPRSTSDNGQPRGAYTDVAAQFLSAGMGWLMPGGTLALLQPLSTLSTRDAGPVRDQLRAQATIRAVWLGTEKHFADAQVATCAIIADVPRRGQPPVQLLAGEDFTAQSQVELAEHGPWSGLLATQLGVPPLELQTGGTLAELAKTTADFRDQYYGLQGHVIDLPAHRQPDADHPPLVLTGHIDPLQCQWGSVAVRFGGQSWQRPVVDRPALALASAKLGAWAQARLVPKLVVATQSKILEAAVDERGAWLNTTPTLSILPRDPKDLWLIAAVVLGAPASVWAWHCGAGSAMSVHAIKLSAKQLAQLPLPADRPLWEQAAQLLQAGHLAPADGRRAALLQASRLMTGAYGLKNPDEIYSFWFKRLAPVKP
jgi:hypothetical protein